MVADPQKGYLKCSTHPGLHNALLGSDQLDLVWKWQVQTYVAGIREAPPYTAPLTVFGDVWTASMRVIPIRAARFVPLGVFYAQDTAFQVASSGFKLLQHIT
jgi:hypothetical protein